MSTSPYISADLKDYMKSFNVITQPVAVICWVDVHSTAPLT